MNLSSWSVAVIAMKTPEVGGVNSGYRFFGISDGKADELTAFSGEFLEQLFVGQLLETV